MNDASRTAKELSEIAHEFNNILNTLNGYSELALEAKNASNDEEYEFFKEKLFSAVGRKLVTAKELTERLRKLQAHFASIS
ncbi:MAG: hypothetical protein V1913_02630 [Fibrobacterota bacterium]